jgi:hypothetical protein
MHLSMPSNKLMTESNAADERIPEQDNDDEEE